MTVSRRGIFTPCRDTIHPGFRSQVCASSVSDTGKQTSHSGMEKFYALAHAFDDPLDTQRHLAVFAQLHPLFKRHHQSIKEFFS